MPMISSTRSETTFSDGSRFDWIRATQQVEETTTNREIVVDITSVDYVSSDDFNLLIRLQLKAKQRDRIIVLENAQDAVQSAFAITRLDRMIPIRGASAATP